MCLPLVLVCGMLHLISCFVFSAYAFTSLDFHHYGFVYEVRVRGCACLCVYVYLCAIMCTSMCVCVCLRALARLHIV